MALIDDNPKGRFEVVGNELIGIDKTPEGGDPVAVRGARQAPGALLLLCGDIWVEDPTEEEPDRIRRIQRAYAQISTDDSGGHGGEFSVLASEPGFADDEHTRELFKINTKVAVFNVPVVHAAGVLETEPPWPGHVPPDDTHGIPEGDFAEILRIYGFESDWFEVYSHGRVTWPQVIARQDERDEYRHFPDSRPGTPEPSPIPPADDWLSPESQVKRRAELTRIAEEVAPMPLDEDRVKKYLMGLNRNLAEVHDDELTRSGLPRDPCEGKNKVPLV